MPGVPNFLANLPFSGEDPQSLVAEISNLGMSAPTLPQNCLEETIIYTLDQIISWPNILRKKNQQTHPGFAKRLPPFPARDVTDVQPLAYHPEPRSEVRSEVPEALQLEIKPPTGSLGFCLGFWGSFWDH
jgi:hypothetical protein